MVEGVDVLADRELEVGNGRSRTETVQAGREGIFGMRSSPRIHELGLPAWWSEYVPEVANRLGQVGRAAQRHGLFVN